MPSTALRLAHHTAVTVAFEAPGTVPASISHSSNSHLMLVCASQLVLGQWQSVMMVDTDGPRARKVGIQAIGFK